MQHRRAEAWPLLILVVALAVTPSFAQLYTGSIAGTASDPTGAVVPNAKVTVTDVSRGFDFSAVTDSDGNFVVRNLPPSTYNVRIEAAGFAPSVRENVVVNVNQ